MLSRVVRSDSLRERFGALSCQKPRCSSCVFIARGSGSTYEWYGTSASSIRGRHTEAKHGAPHSTPQNASANASSSTPGASDQSRCGARRNPSRW